MPGPGSSNAGDPGFIVYHDKIYFSADDSINGQQLWVSDGTAGGTSLMKVLTAATPGSSLISDMIVYNGYLLFKAAHAANDLQLWLSDGTASGTNIIAPAIAPNSNPLSSTNPMIVSGNTLFLAANYSSIGNELWTYTNTTTAITSVSAGQSVSIYPNPFSSAINISGLLSGENYTLHVLDMSGRECFTTDLDHASESASVTMPELSTGVYLIQVKSETETHTFRMVRN